MSAPLCGACAAATAQQLSALALAKANGTSYRKAAPAVGLTEWAVRQHFAHLDGKKLSGGGKQQQPQKPDPLPTNTEALGSIVMNEDGSGVLSTGALDAPITDWDAILLIWNLNPEAFEVVEPVTFKAWDGYGKDNEGELITKRLYSYKARVQRRLGSVHDPVALALEENVRQWQQTLRDSVPLAAVKPVSGRASTYVVAIADAQLGKKGTQEALANWKRGVLGHLNRIRHLIANGHRIERIVLAFQGDEHEQVANNYANQPYTVELNLTQQLELDLDMRIWTIRQFLPLGIRILITSVISNHGEITRNGGKDPVTSKADNSSTMIARMCQRVFEGTPEGKRLEWNIAEANPDIIVELSGVVVLFAHGHIAKGKGQSTEQRSKSAIERQILGRTQELVHLRIAILAHYHHFYMLEDGGRTFFGCPALEADKSSEYMLDQYGVWSPSGMLGLLVGAGHGIRGWAEPAVL